MQTHLPAPTLPDPAARVGGQAHRQPIARALPARVVAFGTAGVLGLGTQLGGTTLLYGRLHLPLWLGSALAIQAAILVTFTVNSQVTWRDRRAAGGRARRFATFEAVSLVGLGLNEAVLLLMATVVGLHYLVASLCGAASASCWNYLANDRVTFGRGRVGRRGAAGLPGVRSD